MKKTIYAILLSLSFPLGLIHAQTIQYGFTVNTDNGLVTAYALPDFSTNDLDVSTALFVFTLPAGTITVPGIPPGPGSGMFTNINDQWEVQRITQAQCVLEPNCLDLLDELDVYLARASLPVDMLSVTANEPLELFQFVITNGCESGGFVEMIENGSEREGSLSFAFNAQFANQFSAQIDAGVQNDLYAGNVDAASIVGCPPVLVPSMSQWALFLFGLSLFTLSTVVIWNLNKKTA